MRLFLKLFLIVCVSCSLTHCTSYDFAKRMVQQGNLLPDEKIKQLKLGMTKEQVATIMGTSLLSPTFNNDRWDYAYTWRKGSGSNTIQRQISIFFTNQRVSRIQTNIH